MCTESLWKVCTWERIVHVRCEIANTWFLHHDAPSHTSFAVRKFLAQHNITMLPHPPYSPDLAPCNLCFFPKLKTHLKGHHFGTVATRDLNKISSEHFLHCYEEWQQRWNCCIQSQGAYFEGIKLWLLICSINFFFKIILITFGTNILHMGERFTQGFGGETWGKRPLGWPRHRWEDNIKMVVQDVEWGGACTGLIWLWI